MSIRPLNDLVLVKVDPPAQTSSIILSPDPDAVPLRKGTVLRIGPGRYKLIEASSSQRRYVPTQAKPGERIVFFGAAAGTRKNRLPTYSLGEDEALIHEEDILFVFDEEVRVEL